MGTWAIIRNLVPGQRYIMRVVVLTENGEIRSPLEEFVAGMDPGILKSHPHFP